ncbi:hypothetical protein SLA2020_369190 [Shorea laevis]
MMLLVYLKWVWTNTCGPINVRVWSPYNGSRGEREKWKRKWRNGFARCRLKMAESTPSYHWVEDELQCSGNFGLKTKVQEMEERGFGFVSGLKIATFQRPNQRL